MIDAQNTVQVFDGLWSSGQLSERDIAQLPTLGVAAVINLALPTSSNALRGEAELVTAQGIAYVQIPVLWEKPELHQLTQFFGAMKAFAGRTIWVHCAMNKRASAFVYLYRRLCLGEADVTAAPAMRQVWTPNEVWQPFITQALAQRPER